ncbi:hypothetical protein [Enterobacter hormaechei]|uniref:hypothetical protein n=1 Tax=Enterobacter hormaechei TaxID=158836 RepID=UPI00092F769D|nr:hypothetical protein [Enterobacter hormaechei]MDR9967933.1 hypothetical protein [Enterobacter hormaechei subsp. xiangfangensis]
MTNIRELSFDEIALVSGGNANGNYEGGGSRTSSSSSNSKTGARNTLARNAPTHIYSDPATTKCGDAVFSGMVGGAIKGGLVGMARGTIGGAVVGQCLSGGGNGNGGGTKAGSNNCSGSDFGGTCNR